MILEDTNGDGRADTAKVFYQGPEVNAPLGICVLGNKVIVSQSPYVWAFYDDNGDDKADRKEVLFSRELAASNMIMACTHLHLVRMENCISTLAMKESN